LKKRIAFEGDLFLFRADFRWISKNEAIFGNIWETYKNVDRFPAL